MGACVRPSLPYFGGRVIFCNCGVFPIRPGNGSVYFLPAQAPPRRAVGLSLPTWTLAFQSGLVLSLPIWIGLGLHFVFPALTTRQKVTAVLFVLLSTACTTAAMAVAYFYLVPTTLNFLLSFAVPGTSLLLSADSYLGFVLLQGIVAFVILQLPLVIILISATGPVSPYTLATKRRFLHPALLVLLAVLTPTTDAVTLALVSIPAALLTEIGMMVGKLLYKGV
jgi:sec-independent protein translocase protein TatC